MLVFETDIAKMNDPSIQQQLVAKGMYADGSTLDQHLSAETYKMLNEYCTSNGIPLEQLKMLNPQLVVVTMAFVELAKLGVIQEGVDMQFYKAAVNDKKVIDGLEAIDAALDALLEYGKGNEDELIAYTISDIKATKDYFEIIVDSWKKGDTEKLNEIFIDELKTETPELYQTLLVDRNNNWMSKIEKYFENKNTEFILVGTLHMVGPDGIIEQLKKRGYKVEKL